MQKEFLIYYDEAVSKNDVLIEQLLEIIRSTYNIKVREVGIRIPPRTLLKKESQSFDAIALLNTILHDGITNFLWIISENLVIDQKEVFGFAEKRKGAILSTKKMFDKSMLIANEALFLIGQVYGLGICPNECVMHVAENLNDLLNKPNKLCQSCEIRFHKLRTAY